MHSGYAIALAWPDTKCKQADSWYDGPMRFLGFNKNGYYKVGHGAIVLINDDTKICKYFDFGRYHSPLGHGRVRSVTSDFDLEIKTKAVFGNGVLTNLTSILNDLQKNQSTDGTGAIHASLIRIDVAKTEAYITRLQEEDWTPYGPFVSTGTNCSRFVCDALLKGNPNVLSKLALRFPATITPTPMWNLMATFNPIVKHYYNEELEQNPNSSLSTQQPN